MDLYLSGEHTININDKFFTSNDFFDFNTLNNTHLIGRYQSMDLFSWNERTSKIFKTHLKCVRISESNMKVILDFL